MRLLFYTADEEYCEYLMGADRRVPSIKGAKSGRPFVGIVFEVKGIPYFAPLTSPKEKHKTMREMPDFMKIAGGRFGAINLNNMIPVPLTRLNEICIDVKDGDDDKTADRKKLLAEELDWCNQNRERIMRRARRLREIVVG